MACRQDIGLNNIEKRTSSFIANNTFGKYSPASGLEAHEEVPVWMAVKLMRQLLNHRSSEEVFEQSPRFSTAPLNGDVERRLN